MFIISWLCRLVRWLNLKSILVPVIGHRTHTHYCIWQILSLYVKAGGREFLPPDVSCYILGCVGTNNAYKNLLWCLVQHSNLVYSVGTLFSWTSITKLPESGVQCCNITEFGVVEDHLSLYGEVDPPQPQMKWYCHTIY